MRNSVRFVGATAIALSMMGLAAPAFAGGDNHKPKPDVVNAAVGGDGGAAGAGGVGSITASCVVTAPVTSQVTADCSAGNGGDGGLGGAASALIGG
jgi:hypothetical protein